MSNLAPWKPGDPLEASRLQRMQEAIPQVGDGTRINSEYGAGIAINAAVKTAAFKPVRLTQVVGPNEGENSSGTPTNFTDREATVMRMAPVTGEWSNSIETTRKVTSLSEVPYEPESREWCISYNGKLVPLSKITFRHAITVDPATGKYPRQQDQPNVFPIKFVTIRYPELPGKRSYLVQYLDASTADPDRHVLNLFEPDPEDPTVTNYLPPGTLIGVFWLPNANAEHHGQWFTFSPGTGDDLSSQSFSASDQSSSDNSSSSESSQSESSESSYSHSSASSHSSQSASSESSDSHSSASSYSGSSESSHSETSFSSYSASSESESGSSESESISGSSESESGSGSSESQSGSGSSESESGSGSSESESISGSSESESGSDSSESESVSESSESQSDQSSESDESSGSDESESSGSDESESSDLSGSSDLSSGQSSQSVSESGSISDESALSGASDESGLSGSEDEISQSAGSDDEELTVTLYKPTWDAGSCTLTIESGELTLPAGASFTGYS